MLAHRVAVDATKYRKHKYCFSVAPMKRYLKHICCLCLQRWPYRAHNNAWLLAAYILHTCIGTHATPPLYLIADGMTSSVTWTAPALTRHMGPQQISIGEDCQASVCHLNPISQAIKYPTVPALLRRGSTSTDLTPVFCSPATLFWLVNFH